jgi:hypothetical protein
MSSVSRRFSAAGLFALGLSLLTCPAQAGPFLPGVQNLNFLSYTGTTPKDYFTNVNPVGWTGGTGLIFIDAPGTADDGTYLSVYSPFPVNSPVGGNFVEADGNPSFESSFRQNITGLTPGDTYTLSFYQAGGQQVGFANGLPTTEQWIVSLGTVGLSVSQNGGPVDPVYGQTGSYFSTDPNASVVASQLMTTPSGGVTPWEFVSVDLVADSTSDILSFLAWGDNGSTVNLPPMVFLSAVNSENVTPEPGTGLLFATVLLSFAVGAAMRHRRRRNRVQA